MSTPLDLCYTHEATLFEFSRYLTKIDPKGMVRDPSQKQCLKDLQAPYNEGNIAQIGEFWLYDHQKLIDRGSLSGRRVAKPRIEIHVSITSKGNLIVEWFPVGANYDGIQSEDCDWRDWYVLESQYGTRPSNELMFIHGIGDLLRNDQPITDPWFPAANHYLLHGCRRALEKLKERLENQYDVTMATDIFVENRATNGIAKWTIEKPETHKARKELSDLENFEKAFHVPLPAFLGAWEEALTPRLSSGALPAPITVSRRMEKSLVNKGHRVFGLLMAMELYTKYRGPPPFIPAD